MRLRRLLLALGAAGSLAIPLVVQLPTGASPVLDGAERGDPETHAAELDSTEAPRITLITGDEVTVIDADPWSETDEPVYIVDPGDTDRTGVTFSVSTTGEATYIVPSDVAALVGPHSVLDIELFNVDRLLELGVGEPGAPLPLIVQGDLADGSLPGVERGADLDSINSTAVALHQDGAADFGAHLASASLTTAPSLGATPGTTELADAGPLTGVSRIWLDGQVEASDWDHNLTQVGAPTLWENGLTGEGVTVAVLDSGIDAEHPDFAGQIVGIANFSNSPTTDDLNGHGTHVAGIVAGTGASAPEGTRQGVAPDSALLIGKVLGDDGNGTISATVEAMEWAVDEGADIVNLSFGSGPTDGTDPASLALDTLSEASGTLFVVAGGNHGPGPGTVTAPAAADRALAVAAVDGSDVVAPFSSRGPRVGDRAIKPEVSGPGVEIVAPKSGQSLGEDGPYETRSGTSMATPHVSGIAALLVQQYPDWDADRLKAALMATSAPAEGGLAAAGAGRVDGPAAVEATILPEQPHVAFILEEGSTSDSSTVTLTNLTDQPITAAVATETDTPEGTTPFSVAPGQVEIPAAGAIEVSVEVDLSALPVGAEASGRLVVTPETGSSLTIPMSASQIRWLEVTALTTTGAPASGAAILALNHDNGQGASTQTNPEGTASIPFTGGAVAVSATIGEQGEDGSITSVVTTEVADGATNVVLDASTAVPVGAETAPSLSDDTASRESMRASREDMALVILARLNEASETSITNGILAGGAYGPITRGQLRVTPTTGTVPGTVGWYEHWMLADATSDPAVGDTRVAYDLVFSSDAVPSDPIQRVTEQDRDQLAQQGVKNFAPTAPHRSQFGSTVIGDDVMGLNTTTHIFLETPSQLIRYTTGGDYTWAEIGSRSWTLPDGSLQNNLRARFVQFAPGEVVQTSYWEAPLGAGAELSVATRPDGSTALIGSANIMVDAAGRVGNYGEFTVPQQGVSTAAIYRDGEHLGTNPPQNGFDVDHEPAVYEIERSYTSDEVFPIGGNTEARWVTEPIGHEPGVGAQTPLPTLQATWSVSGLSLWNTVRPDRTTPVSVTLTSHAIDPGDRAIASATMEYTTDAGATWHEFDSTWDGDDLIGAIPAEELPDGTWVGLRVAADDEAGNSVEQTLLRAFPVSEGQLDPVD